MRSPVGAGTLTGRQPPVPASTPGARDAIVAAARRLDALGLNRGTSGNIGLRTGASFLVTPSGVPVEDLSPDGIVEMDFRVPVLARQALQRWGIGRDILATLADFHPWCIRVR